MTALASTILRTPARQTCADELERLSEHDSGPCPQGGKLSPRALVRAIPEEIGL
ncbi:MAG: hypothetical protein LBL59_02665 [Xanthomonadaceae bacterium]|jgi:hypothetical protein|nr:hypothetical protein [Xanthomonadaceae bacterium]